METGGKRETQLPPSCRLGVFEFSLGAYAPYLFLLFIAFIPTFFVFMATIDEMPKKGLRPLVDMLNILFIYGVPIIVSFVSHRIFLSCKIFWSRFLTVYVGAIFYVFVVCFFGSQVIGGASMAVADAAAGDYYFARLPQYFLTAAIGTVYGQALALPWGGIAAYFLHRRCRKLLEAEEIATR